MVETISLEVEGKVPQELLEQIYSKITPEYIKGLFGDNKMSIDDDTIGNVTFSYEIGFPTKDLALRAFDFEDGMKFWGIASGYTNRPEKVSVKYLILEHIQETLNESGISSEINIADLNRETVEYMEARGIFKGKLSELKKIAGKRGNMENMVVGAKCAIATPIE